MQISRRLFTTVLVLPPSSLLSAVRGDEVRYVGGTISSVPQGQDGSLLINPAVGLLFECKKGKFDIPFDQISSIEYGQKAGRRIGVAVVINPLFLLSKKRKHFVTMGYKDATGMRQGVVFELSKGLPAKIIAMVEARAGIKCEYESEEARKHLHG